MATLVLTAVGTALGGPIGGALGALAGNALDHQLFAPAGREGARLAELRVQLSSYGAPIAKLWGTMRVAGTVIWATDLLETRGSSRGGKGQPSVTQYSYAASFAVLLSGRAVLGVGRIWADGALIRGAGGDWKVPTAFRLHPGVEDQAVDPLIASAEGRGLTPAHRGCAYAVFEQLQLATFGNRIPSLSFEVIADADPVGVGAIAGELADVAGASVLTVDGFAATGGTVRDVLDLLGQASGAWFAPVGGGLAMIDAARPVTRVVDQGGAGSGREVATADSAPVLVSVRHYDPARDWQAGLQRARRPEDGVALALDVPAAVSAAAAKGIAAAVLARGAAARVTRTVTARLDALMLVPGDAVEIAGEAGVWRVEAVSLEAMRTVLTLKPLSLAPAAEPASAGRVLAAPDRVVGTTLLHAVELPALDDAVLTQPRLVVMATGTGEGWRTAALLLSLDAGASWTVAGATALPAVIGVVEVAPGPGLAEAIDLVDSAVVVLARADMTLEDAEDARLAAGANLALIGGELIQFGRAEPLGDARWRLSRLWRARRGVAGAVAAGGRFVLLEPDAVRAIELPLSALGGSVRVMAAGIGDGEPVMVDAAVTGASVLPFAPVGLSWTASADGGAVVRWARRSRAGWGLPVGVATPLVEESESYRVSVVAADGTRDVRAGEPGVVVSAAERAGGAVRVSVRQRGTYGESPAATIVVDGG